MEFENLDNVAKNNVFSAGNSHWQLITSVCHLIHINLPENNHRTYYCNVKNMSAVKIPTTRNDTKIHNNAQH